MKTNINRWVLLVFVQVVLVLSCDSGKDVVQLISGKWIVNDVVRRGKSTNTLNGLSFEFQGDSVFTNLPGMGNNTYKFHADSITIESTPSLKFHVQKIDTSVLILSGNIRNTPFVLTFNRPRS